MALVDVFPEFAPPRVEVQTEGIGMSTAEVEALRNLAMSLSIEVSELMEHIQWAESPHDQQGWREELADVLLYLMQLASLSGVSLEQAVLDKLEKNAGRTWEQRA